LLVVLLASLSTQVHAQDAKAEQAQQAPGERIANYHSRIVVAEDGSLAVTETITVEARGKKIKRGIYRDYPTVYSGKWFTRVQVPFEIKQVLRGGKPEPWHTKNRSNGVRVYIGRKDVRLKPGRYTYTLVYRTDRQLGFFKKHDELYWNVTGNGWDFSIEHASAAVVLPAGVPRKQIRHEGYTGASGSKARNLKSNVDGASGEVRFSTTGRLGRHEGLTIVVMFPKGHVAEPTDEEKREAFLQANRILVAGAVGLAVVLLYYLVAWVGVGRDPEKGIIFPHFEPPQDLPPACMRYVHEMGFDKRCLTAAVVNMGVKGYLRIDEDDGEYTLRRLGKGDKSVLSPGEKRIASALLKTEVFRLAKSKTAAERMKKAVRSLREMLKLEYDGTAFLANRKWLIPGLVLSVLAILTAVLTGPATAIGGFLFLCVWLTIWTFGVTILLTSVFSAWSDVRRGGKKGLAQVGSVGGAIFLTLFAVPFVAAEIGALVALAAMTSIWMVPLLLGLVGINFLFFHLIKQPTRAGRRIMDQIDGFRMYLAAAEIDRLNRMKFPQLTPEVFEKFLPYAIALDVENEWSNQFAEEMEKVGHADDDGYCPTWYRGAAWSTVGAAGFAATVGSSLSGAISSASSPPGSSSGGGGGGSSGGGGGGGGGGGW
ncbi:MAG: DUF2207 domain-containing protein, partial [Phycisphaerae bacterium]|nr:DUF2207 domain-containing protein [Phycisphaerae bacterium]